ncbi:MAG TPA: DmsC/YnfH family molybdoenzyme membrane anchor subunit, partial [Candidatus Didemnitutus sp.]|nr:DmsC/YnfH family molybdoenzyme membrane anchor subunit [Candidatus Didemnitutus sp.]
VTTACHHCADPGCLNGCPVLAYEKDPRTGIVRHLDDQCIGCQYCILTCPYDVPKYNDRLGIVRKCDMCHQRLGAGEAPACVQACPTQAIRIVTVYTHNRETDTSLFLPGAPAPELTQPTTRYISTRALPSDLRAADAGFARVQPAHTPLAIMLILTQAALGLEAAALFVANRGTGQFSPSLLNWAAWTATLSGLVVSVAHLGQPLRAWRIFLNLRESWLSREAVLFGAWFAALSGALVLEHGWLEFSRRAPAPPFAAVALVLGSLGVACSAMIYAATGRKAWRPAIVLTKFFATVLFVAATIVWPVAGAGVLALKLFSEELTLQFGPVAPRQLAAGVLRPVFLARRILGVIGAALLVLSLLAPHAWLLGGALALAGEFVERSVFFRAVDASRMPGQPSA